MASTVPAKSQPLHNFTLPHLKWNKDRNSSGHHQRRRSVKSPSRRPSISSASPVRHSPLRDSVSATPPRHQSPFSESVSAAASAASPRGSPVHGDYLGKRSPTLGESSKPHPSRERGKHSPSGGDPPLQPARHDSAPDSEASGKGRGGFAEHRRNHPNHPTVDGARHGIYSTNSERTTQKSEAKSKSKEADAAGIKRSKILIKIPCKSSKTEDGNPQEEPPLKTENHDDEDDCSGEAQEEERINNNNIDEETKTWNLRPRRPIHKSLYVSGGPSRNTGQPLPERSKAQSPLRSLNNRSGENDGAKKEKRKLSVSVSLTKDEIEEDIFALTGSKPARRPKKRAKNIQKQVDVR